MNTGAVSAMLRKRRSLSFSASSARTRSVMSWAWPNTRGGAPGFLIENIAVEPDAFAAVAGHQAHETRVAAVAADAVQVGVEKGPHGRGEKALHIHADAFLRAETRGTGGGGIDDQQDAVQIVDAHQAQTVFEQFAVQPLVLAQRLASSLASRAFSAPWISAMNHALSVGRANHVPQPRFQPASAA